jgi:hypothetical protein
MPSPRHPLQINITAAGIEILGAIDENAHLTPLVRHARGGRLVIDLAGVMFINSIGVREWVRLQSEAAAAKVRLELRRVADVIIHQMNIIPAARGVSIVSSFFAPYECEHCDCEQELLIDVTEHGAALARFVAPQMACPRCKRTMDLAEPPELYLAFLRA